MSKKVLIINSPLFEDKDPRNLEDYLPPLGLGIIATSVAKKHEVNFIDTLADNRSLPEIHKLLIEETPQFIGINIFTTNYSIVRKIVEGTKFTTHWIIGGISTKSLFKEIFQWETNNPIDVVYGDGEIIINDIIDSCLSAAPDESEQNRRFFIVQSFSKYNVKDISNEALNRRLFHNEPQVNVSGDFEICIYTSRGCPHNCAYCVAARSRNKEILPVRRKKKASIVGELRKIQDVYPKVTAIRILDDLFLSSQKNFEEAISIFNNFSFSWRAMCHIKSIAGVSDEILYEITKSGCKELFIGIESGSERILQKIHKEHNIKTIENSVKRVLLAGMNVKGYFICGFPKEQQEDLEKTITLAARLTSYSMKEGPRFRNSTFQFRPYYGTELYEEIVNLIDQQQDFILQKMKPSDALNVNVRSKSFNFDGGNFSAVDDKQLMKYIKRMEELNA